MAPTVEDLGGWYDERQPEEFDRYYKWRRGAGLPKRPSRRPPSIDQIAEHWNLPSDECWKCGDEGPVERAHLVDRFEYETGAGLDGVQNLALICFPCHKRMPATMPDQWVDAMIWAGLGGHITVDRASGDLLVRHY